MKLRIRLVCVLTVGSGIAWAQQPHVDQAYVQLNTVGTTVIASQSGLFANASITSVSCIVVAPVSGAGVTNLTVSVDGGGPMTISLYDAASTWPYVLQPFQIRGTVQGGADNGDAFFIPIHAKYAYSLNVSTVTTSATAGGTLSCSVIRNQ